MLQQPWQDMVSSEGHLQKCVYDVTTGKESYTKEKQHTYLSIKAIWKCLLYLKGN